MTRKDIFSEPDDAATPLTAEERRDLIPAYIAFKQDLNDAEQENIARGQECALRRTRTDILTEKFILELHRQMLKDVWKWAGKFRKTERNIGIDWWLIPTRLHQLLGDVQVWVEHGSYSPDELALRFHHTLVLIHPFPNGNGRHARLVADLLVMRSKRDRFSWGRQSLREAGTARARYIEALREADHHNMEPLVRFARA